MTLPAVYLALSGSDEPFVRRVAEHLPDGLAYFYTRSFENGENLIAAMESRIAESTIFALFASQESIKSTWVAFEIDRARFANVQRRNLRILAFPIEAEVGFTDLPPWLREHWIPRAGLSPRDIARYIRGVLSSGGMAGSATGEPFGRGAFVDATVRNFHEAVLQTADSPNVFLFAGHSGIGRRTVARKFLESVFPALPDICYGPEFMLPQFADLADLYRALRQEIDVKFSLSGFERDLAAFASLSTEDRANEIALHLSYFGRLGQVVTVVTGNGIYEDRGILKPWANSLFRALDTDRESKLCIIANRQIHENERRPHPNVLQFFVPPIDDGDIRALMIATAPAFGAEPQVPTSGIISAIGGHPGIAKAATRLMAQKGAVVLDQDMRQLYDIQEEVLSESFDVGNLSPIETDVLSILSWVPQLSGQMLQQVILMQHKDRSKEFADATSSLILACLVLVSGPNYLISNPIRGMFRRKHGYGSLDLRHAFSEVLKKAWRESANDDELRAELFDALVYMTALEGGTLPPEFKKLLLPSTLQEVVRDAYYRRNDDENALKRVIAWGMPSKEMSMDETTREEILSYVVRAQVRLQDYPSAEDTLAFFDKRSYRSRFYMRSFLIRHSGRNLRDAVGQLLQAKQVGKYMRQVIGDLALCYQKLGMWSELRDLLNEQEQYISRNPVLLDVKIGMLIAENKIPEAEIAIRNLEAMPYEDGRAASRKAMIVMKQGHYHDAQAQLTTLLELRTGGQIPVRRLRAIAAAHAGDFATARRDADFLRPRPGGKDMAFRIEARIKLSQGDFAGAEAELSKVRSKSVQDRLFQARILDGKANDIQTPLAHRDEFRQEALAIRAQNRMVDEFDLEGG